MNVKLKKIESLHKLDNGSVFIMKMDNKEKYICELCKKTISKKDLIAKTKNSNNKVIKINQAEELKRLKRVYYNIAKKKSKSNKIWTKDKNFWSEDEFISWYQKQKKMCYYCKITEDDLKYISDNNKEVLPSARSVTRGRNFEIDRKIDTKAYNEGNCCLACYWCNNAKSDCFTPEEFEPIGKAIGATIRKIIDNSKKIKLE